MDGSPPPYNRFRSLCSDPRRYLQALVGGYRARGDFAKVRAYCLFLGTPRSGHTLIGAMLNAHRNALIAQGLDIPRHLAEGMRRSQLYWLIRKQDRKFTHRKGSMDQGFDFAIPGQWQGRYESIEIIGSKRGGAAARAFAADPTLYGRLARTVGVAMRIVHVVRHPYDNIATISRRHELPLAEASDFYFEMCGSADRILGDLDERERLTLHHEGFVAAPEQGLGRLCAFLDLPVYSGYLEDCAKLAWNEPRRSREKVEWPDALRGEIAERAQSFRFLSGYEFSDRRA